MDTVELMHSAAAGFPNQKPVVAPILSIGNVLKELRHVKDQKDAVNAELKGLNERESELEAKLIEYHKVTEVSNVGDENLSVTFGESLRFSYDPEKWDEIVHSLDRNGKLYCVQRRLNDAKLRELIENGEELPEGLRTESYVKVSIRRK